MTLLHAATPTPSDAELIARVRGGDSHAYGQLFDRHRGAADRLARHLAPRPDADDLVAEAFTKVLGVLRSGGGPDLAFRAYLLTAVRRLHVDRVRASNRVQPSDDLAQWDPGIPFQDPAVDDFERSAASRAFASLPERWQLVLWHLEVEQQKPAEVGVLLGMSPNSVSALAYRAREGLRQAYLRMHLADTAGETCRWTTEHLGAHVRGGLARRDSAKVEEHLAGCVRCSGLYDELCEVNQNLRGLVAPLLLGGAAAAYLGSAAPHAVGSAVLAHLGHLHGLALAKHPALALAAGGVATAAVGGGMVAAVHLGVLGHGQPQSLSPPPSSSSSAASAGMGGANAAAPLRSGIAGDLTKQSPATRTGQAANQNAAGASAASTTATSSPVSPTVPVPSASVTMPLPTISGQIVPTSTPTSSISPSVSPSTSPSSSPTGSTPPPTQPTGTQSDLALSLTAELVAASQWTLTAAVTETSPPAAQLTLTAQLPPGAEPTWAGTGWSCQYDSAAGSLQCSAPGSALPPALVVTVSTQQTYTVTVSVDAPDNSDPDPANNSASVVIS
jgi:RNA polymerase sigma factor (sigma-70 family)